MNMSEQSPIISRGQFATCLLLTFCAGLALGCFLIGANPRISEVWVREAVGHLGTVGPLALTGLTILAIVFSPIPSGPIAVAAGALYGVLWGASVTIIGAFLGALAAFVAARYLGLARVLCGSATNFLTRATRVARSEPMASSCSLERSAASSARASSRNGAMLQAAV